MAAAAATANNVTQRAFAIGPIVLRCAVSQTSAITGTGSTKLKIT